MTALDFNTAGTQRDIDVIPDRTIALVQITVRPGGGSDNGWLRRSKNGASEGLDLEFVVVDGQYAKRKFWQLLTLKGETPNHIQAGEISMRTLRAIIESARGIKPSDESEAAKAARVVNGWADFHGLRFWAQIGVRPPEGAYSAKNFLAQVITPEKQCWKPIEQVPVQPIQPNGGGNGFAPVTSGAPPAGAPPAGAIDRPAWAQ